MTRTERAWAATTATERGGGAGEVLDFDIDELRLPAKQLDEFNDHIAGQIARCDPSSRD